MNRALKFAVQTCIIFTPTYLVFGFHPWQFVNAAIEYINHKEGYKLAAIIGSVFFFYFFFKNNEESVISSWASDHGYSVIRRTKCGLLGTRHTIIWLWSTVYFAELVDTSGKHFRAWISLGYRSVRVEGVVFEKKCEED